MWCNIMCCSSGVCLSLSKFLPSYYVERVPQFERKKNIINLIGEASVNAESRSLHSLSLLPVLNCSRRNWLNNPKYKQVCLFPLLNMYTVMMRAFKAYGSWKKARAASLLDLFRNRTGSVLSSRRIRASTDTIMWFKVRGIWELG